MRVQIIPVCLAVALMASGCDDKSTPPAVDGGVPAGPARVLTTLKDEKPYILMDMSPELGTFKSLQGTERETFLLRRAVKAVHEHGLKETKFTGKDSFVVRMVLVEGKDEYNRPKWGSAKRDRDNGNQSRQCRVNHARKPGQPGRGQTSIGIHLVLICQVNDRLDNRQSAVWSSSHRLEHQTVHFSLSSTTRTLPACTVNFNSPSFILKASSGNSQSDTEVIGRLVRIVTVRFSR